MQLPAGIIEQGETVEQVAVRELLEETGMGQSWRCHHDPSNTPEKQSQQNSMGNCQRCM